MSFHKIVLPTIRKVMPTLLARDIIGSQPMNVSYSSLFQYNPKMYNVKYWPYQLNLDHGPWDQVHNAERWCYENFNSRNWKHSGRQFVFKRQSDATLFALKWL